MLTRNSCIRDVKTSLSMDGEMGVVPDNLVLLLQSWVSEQLYSSVSGDLGKKASYKLHASDMNNSDCLLCY